MINTKSLQTDHQINAVIGFGECWPAEAAFHLLGAGLSAQPISYNPRKQRKNSTTLGSRERFRGGKWRSRWDSNPRDPSGPTPLAGERLRPLGHSSADGHSEAGRRRQGEMRVFLRLPSFERRCCAEVGDRLTAQSRRDPRCRPFGGASAECRQNVGVFVPVGLVKGNQLETGRAVA